MILRYANISEVLAIWPTWLVVKDHVPIEHSKEAAEFPQGKDEEQTQTGVSEKEPYVVGEAVSDSGTRLASLKT